MITDGTSQTGRFNPALAEGYFDIDEMVFEDLLAMAADHARNLRFFNPDNEPDGDWEAFFSSDEAVIIAMILTTDLRMMESDFFNGIDRNISMFGNDYDLNSLPSYKLAIKIDFWFNRLRLATGVAAENLTKRIGEIISGTLRGDLISLRTFLLQFGSGPEHRFTTDFSAYWFAGSNAGSPSYHVPTPSDSRQEIERFLRVNFHSFYNAVSTLKTFATRAMPDSLVSRTHPPAAGLFIAFIKLFQRAQEKANLFTQRHLDFYYHDLLKVQHRPMAPDSTHLIMYPNVEGREIPIGKGTEFLAGEGGNNQTVIYTADSDLLVRGARVAALYTLFFEHDPDKSPEHELGFTSGAKAIQIPAVREPDSAVGTEQSVWPLFGAPKSSDEERSIDSAEIGFAIASPVLFLKEGRRQINLRFKTDFQGNLPSQAMGEEASLDSFLGNLASLLRESSPADAFYKAFRQMFTVYLTTESGWYQVPDYLPLSHVVDDECEINTFKIQILLPLEVDPVVSYSPEVHGWRFDCELPIILFTINPEAYFYPYSLLKDIVVDDIEIEVEVEGVRELVLHNNIGQLDPTGPFSPFGPIPTVGSYLIAGNAEIARKQVTQFQMDVEWGDLPADGRGFGDYYREYGLRFDNSVFQAHATVLRDGRWLPNDENEQPVVRLFGSDATDKETASWSNIKTNRLTLDSDLMRIFKPTDTMPLDAELSYSSLAKNGFFKFTLNQPDYAFGHKEYPLRLTNVLTTNAQLKKPELFMAVPNPPYTPLINSISINYRAVSTIALGQITSANEGLIRERFFHIHPFGSVDLSLVRSRNINLVPQYDAPGNLFIGFAGEVLSGTLTMFFRLREDCAPEAGTEPAGLVWYYLSSNRWIPLKQSDVISDTTNGFLTSGIVTLNIPDDINRDNTAFPGDLLWLRVSAFNRPEDLCSLYSIQAQALKVSRQVDENPVSRLQRRLPAGTIKESRISIPGLGRIDQIVDSFGGDLPESAEHLKTRTSERLRHKNRALAPWDYERLILDRFPEVFKVKCFANMVADPVPENRLRPGHILIVVIPDPKEHPAVHLKPTVNGMVLQEIKEFVQRRASPFVELEVRNPTYEQIQIRCTVKFRGAEGRGYYLNALDLALSDYISPWSTTGGYHAEFGWSIRRYDIESFIRSRDYVEMVTNYSMLHIADDSKGYQYLYDTENEPEGATEIHPMYPWSIAVPVRRHFIETTDRLEPIQPELTGVDELEIGSTFIITRG